MAKPRVLVNLPAGFFKTPATEPAWRRLEAFAEVRQTSFNTADEIEPDLQWADAVLMWSWPVLTNELLDRCPNLKMAAQLDISQRGAQVALQRSLPVSVGRSAFSPAVAEMALGLILSGLRRISEYHRAMREGTEVWVGSFPDSIDPRERELTGKTVGIVGLGRVGQRLAELLAPFRCPLLVADPFVSDEVLSRFVAERVSVAELSHRSEVIVLCAASNSGSKALFGAGEFGTMKADTVFVNVARAALVETGALVRRLAHGDLVAAIDVFDQEPLPSDHPLRTAPNALLTPHRAGGTMASVDRILNGLIQDIESFFTGQPLSQPLLEAMVPSLDA